MGKNSKIVTIRASATQASWFTSDPFREKENIKYL
jgi:hypothetical protein